MAKNTHDTPMLDQLEGGPWPSFVSGLKRLAEGNGMMGDLLGQLEHSYQTKKGYWKGGTVGVIGYGGGVIPRFSEVAERFPQSAEFHTLRIMPAPGLHYSTDVLRKLCEIWERHGSGLIALHGQSGDMMFQGCRSDEVQAVFDELNELGFDMGGAGPSVRTAMSCVGHARCEHSCYDEGRAHRTVLNAFTDDLHRPALPYKFKFKFSGCSNDCMNSIQRSDMAVLGTWRDAMRVDQDEVRRFVQEKGREYVIDNVVTRCPTRSLRLKKDDTLEVDDKNCVRCMHCINVMTKALSPGRDRGVTVLVGGKRTLKIGDLFGTVIKPFMKLDTDEDYQALVDLGQRIIDFWAENGLEHERCGEMIDRIGLTEFLEAIGEPVDPAMVDHPRTNPYVRTDGWAEAAEEWKRRHEAI
ncbi:MAG: dissimilatory-type sulfite reductase subunit alpha [Gammaproteobacteria bacterium]|nr:dissimilatory-type sulfite reductase subunit alpha [Gammaproteobacteria bacterium]NIR86001.1 dissimilatory-type sulfite reductase subunit alpha [Gammaproteobacteria bacterium]NIU07243.1 dissimilatory-type sulfite reductase subunit alpha [Gammaproteobacteria bacterium]NIV54046.1 dissimilatory-type sulfite reductase subunit alpha [Gammaproteobacteria bacterium]NIV77089.1 dissimilatory-type sulfite reductase subunit alpha [Gammaproteobacteria bacterium]